MHSKMQASRAATANSKRRRRPNSAQQNAKNTKMDNTRTRGKVPGGGRPGRAPTSDRRRDPRPPILLRIASTRCCSQCQSDKRARQTVSCLKPHARPLSSTPAVGRTHRRAPRSAAGCPQRSATVAPEAAISRYNSTATRGPPVSSFDSTQSLPPWC